MLGQGRQGREKNILPKEQKQDLQPTLAFLGKKKVYWVSKKKGSLFNALKHKN